MSPYLLRGQSQQNNVLTPISHTAVAWRLAIFPLHPDRSYTSRIPCKTACQPLDVADEGTGCILGEPFST